MSVITLPRREIPTRVAAHRKRRSRAATWARLWSERSTLTKVGAILLVSITVILLGNAYATQRQIEIHQLQSELQQSQAIYASQVAGLSNSTAPARIAKLAHGLPLVPASEFTSIPMVPLNVPLPLPTLNASYTPTSRLYR